MCQSHEIELSKPTPRSPWRRFFRQPSKPKLSRKVVSGARINLNKYWSKFEEVTSNALLAPVLLRPEVADNEINDNLTNEWREADHNLST